MSAWCIFRVNPLQSRRQPFVKNPDLNIKKLIAEVAGKVGGEIAVKSFHKLNLGEGIEKKEDNLADEVAKMTSGQ